MGRVGVLEDLVGHLPMLMRNVLRKSWEEQSAEQLAAWPIGRMTA